MTSVGETLRRARLQRNLELNRIADELKISASMLRAIEEERFDKLPGGVFARSFVRQYARLLELDEDEIVSELKRVMQPPLETPEPARAPHVPAADIPLPRMSGWQAVSDKGIRWSSSVGALMLMLVVMLACAGAYAWWQRARHPSAARVRTPAAAPAAQPAAEPSPPSQPAASIPEPATPAAPAIPSAAPAQAEPEKLPAPAPVPPAAKAAVPPETPAPAPNPNAAVQVEIAAQEDAWISARADGQYVFSGVLEANQTRTVTADRNVLLRLGNAGGVEIRLNGKPIRRLGGKGAVRTLQLTSGGFQIVPPEAPKPASPAESPNPL